MSERFYINWPLGPGLVSLTGPEAHHLSTVCRRRPGDQVRLFNGDGKEYEARIVSAARREVTADIVSVEQPERELPFHLEVAAPLPKGDRSQFLVEKLTEMGVTAFVPLKTARSLITPREAKLDKLNRHVIEASKQCGRNVLMRVEPLTPWENYLRRENLPGIRIFGEQGGLPFAEVRARLHANANLGFTVAIGPEGGFAPEEAQLAREAGWLPIHMGPRTLRIETAALALVSWVVQTE